MKITMHGAGREVGRSCIEVNSGRRRILLDGGLKIMKDRNIFPTTIADPEKIEALFLSHAHMDHSGALPMLYHSGINCPIVTTSCTKDLTRILLMDSWKIDRMEGREKVYKKNVIMNVLDAMYLKRKGEIKGIRFSMYSTGHIPSSKAIRIEFEGTSILYSGDVNGTTTQLLDGVTSYPQSDVLILESTYGSRNHPPRKESEQKFIDCVKDTLKRGGIALCAAFAVGRAQELMILLTKAGITEPIYLDGMSKKVLDVFLKHDYELKDKSLHKAAQIVKNVDGWNMRKQITKKPCVIIATAGMLDAGPVLGYLGELYDNRRNSVIMTGYQAEGSNGRLLLENGHVELDDRLVRVDAQIEHFDLSAHASMDDLHKTITAVRPKHLVLNHGDPEGVEALAAFAQSQGIKVYTPATGTSIDLEE